MFDKIVSWLNWALGAILSFLPDSPFQKLLNSTPVADYLGYVAYFVDIGFIVSVFDAWLAVIAVYYVYMAILRWVKALGDN